MKVPHPISIVLFKFILNSTATEWEKREYILVKLSLLDLNCPLFTGFDHWAPSPFKPCVSSLFMFVWSLVNRLHAVAVNEKAQAGIPVAVVVTIMLEHNLKVPHAHFNIIMKQLAANY